MDAFLGEIRMFAGGFIPDEWALCDGSLISIQGNEDLYKLLGTTYGGDGITNFALPDLRGRVPVGQMPSPPPPTPPDPYVYWRLGDSFGSETVSLLPENLNHNHLVVVGGGDQGQNPKDSLPAKQAGCNQYYGAAQPSSTVTMHPQMIRVSEGGNQAHNNMMPTFCINFMIALKGFVPRDTYDGDVVPFVGEIRPFAFGFEPSRVPAGWLPCDGATLQVQRYVQLFALIGSTYGGDGQNTFSLPDLRGRVPLCRGTNQNGKEYQTGDAGGLNFVELGGKEIPSHNHLLRCSTSSATTNIPQNAVPAQTPNGCSNYAIAIATPTCTFAAGAIAPAGQWPHNNIQPSLTISFCIATDGEFPPSDK